VSLTAFSYLARIIPAVSLFCQLIAFSNANGDRLRSYMREFQGI
jgi:hypothetical protein